MMSRCRALQERVNFPGIEAEIRPDMRIFRIFRI